MGGAVGEAAPTTPAVADRRRRRPTGAPPPLPRSIGVSGWLWLLLMVAVAVGGAILLRVFPAPIDRFDAAISRALASFRTPLLTDAAEFLNTLNARATLPLLGLLTVILIAAFKRWRHLVVFFGVVAVLRLVTGTMQMIVHRPRPYDVTQLAGWAGYAMPSIPVTVLTALLLCLAYSMVVPGRPRWYAKWAIGASVVGLGLVRVYLGVDHTTDVVFGAILAIAVPVVAFRAFAGNETFPIRYGAKGKAAHLDVTGRRGEAIREAIAEQLGYEVSEVEPVGLEGSGGSTPLRLEILDEQGRRRTVFAKLYAKSHVRADRWYKLGRRMIYGALEDETAFPSVRRFVEYEDYTLRLLGEEGFPTPEALGVVEITPEREYMILMEFFEGAVEIGEAEVDERVIDQGLEMIRRMWDVGIAHRDIKPANLMVRDDSLKLIDVFFVQVRPSPWRQAVDLGNMMLVLALRSDADTVYERALRWFTPDDLAEAFAATRGVASPSQLRTHLKEDGRDLLARFRELAPQRPPIRVQRWSVKRVGLILATVIGVGLGTVFLGGLFLPPDAGVAMAECEPESQTILIAQSVPTATRVPCVRDLPLGWSSMSTEVTDGRVLMTFGVGSAVSPVVTVVFAERCDPAPGPAVSSQDLPVEGGCAAYTSTIPFGSQRLVGFGSGLGWLDRRTLVDHVRDEEDLTLCGAEAPPCP
jgi:tRNA A-37 threonylcarbamoyl transferase component Bud32/membrane-associated phospholipid phosphatase